MINTAAIAGVLALIGLVVFFWRQFGGSSGRGLGNRIAAHMGIRKSLFYLLLENGAKGSARDALIDLERMQFDVDAASVELAPQLARGIERLEARFGAQEMYEEAKPVVARLVSEFERKRSAAAE